jgi:hypothetical protein
VTPIAWFVCAILIFAIFFAPSLGGGPFFFLFRCEVGIKRVKKGVLNDHVRNVLIELLGGVRIACFLKLTSAP